MQTDLFFTKKKSKVLLKTPPSLILKQTFLSLGRRKLFAESIFDVGHYRKKAVRIYRKRAA